MLSLTINIFWKFSTSIHWTLYFRPYFTPYLWEVPASFFLFYSFVTCNADCESSWLWQVNACAIMRMTCIFFFFLACELTGKLSGALGSSVQNAWAILPWGDSASVTLNSPSQNRLLVFARILMVPCPLSLWSLRWKEGLWF